MRIIEIKALDNGAHRNQTFHGVLPEGWAVVHDGMQTENFPFGDITVEGVDGVMTVTSWTPGIMPEPGPEAPEGEITDADVAAAILEGVNEV